MVTTYLSDHVSELFHIQENILAGEKTIAHFADLKDPQKQITDYLTRTIQAFVSTSLDAFLDAEKAGKIEAYLSYLGGTWPCVEGNTTGITEFRLTTYQFKPVLGETGKSVVRAITEADIDALGEAVMDTILFG